MAAQYSIPNLKLGCTSFVIPDYYVPAIGKCISLADDISLLLLEAGDKGNHFISQQEMKEIVAIAQDHPQTTWNIHLPTDGDFSSPLAAQHYVDNIKRAIDLTLQLHPHSWVMHVVTDKTPETTMRPPLSPTETELILNSLDAIKEVLPHEECLCLENLERHPIDYLDHIIAQTTFSRCFDIGHVWKENWEPQSLFETWLPRTRMIHLHGIGTRDHQGLHHMNASQIDAVMHGLWDAQFQGAITLEVFQLEEFIQSYHAINSSYQRYQSTNLC